MQLSQLARCSPLSSLSNTVKLSRCSRPPRQHNVYARTSVRAGPERKRSTPPQQARTAYASPAMVLRPFPRIMAAASRPWSVFRKSFRPWRQHGAPTGFAWWRGLARRASTRCKHQQGRRTGNVRQRRCAPPMNMRPSRPHQAAIVCAQPFGSAQSMSRQSLVPHATQSTLGHISGLSMAPIVPFVPHSFAL